MWRVVIPMYTTHESNSSKCDKNIDRFVIDEGEIKEKRMKEKKRKRESEKERN